jgi:hypothetical protein
MNRFVVLIMSIIFSALSAHAELHRVEMTVFGMD